MRARANRSCPTAPGTSPTTRSAVASSRTSRTVSRECSLTSSSASRLNSRPSTEASVRNCLHSGVRRPLRQIREVLPQLGDDLGNVRRTCSELGAQRNGIALPHIGAERLDPRPIGGGSARLPAAPDEDPRAADSRVFNQFVREAALSDPRLSGEKEEPSVAGEGLLEPAEKLGELSLSADED